MSELILGVDPGLSGALALIDRKSRGVVFLKDMPTLSSKDRMQIDASGLFLALDAYAKDIAFAVVEDVSAMVYINARGETRGQGASASFSFGKSVGVLHGVLSSAGISIRLVKPSVWKMLMGLSRNKNESIEKAKKFFPSASQYLTRKKDDGRAEALLLAHFGADRFQ